MTLSNETHYLYVIERSDGLAYVGVTNNPVRRLKEHISNGNAHLKGRTDLEMCVILSGDKETIYGLENYFIDQLGSELNIHPGGCFPKNHKANPGEKNGRAKFTEEDIISIRQAYAAGQSQESLAAEYARPKVTISKIVTGETWKETSGPISPKVQGRRSNSLKAEEVLELKELFRQGVPGRLIAEKFNIGLTTAYRWRDK